VDKWRGEEFFRCNFLTIMLIFCIDIFFHGKLEDQWRNLLTEKVKALEWSIVTKDIEVLLEDRSDLNILSRDLLLTNLHSEPASL
jgi:hypothetical protein